MKKSIERSEWAKLILFLAILFGAFLRFNPTLLAGFPINDGGMFAAMVDDLRSNRYLIPAFTSYNHSSIPFAYPPLGFFLGALAADIFGLRSIEAVRWIPALFASLSIPAFYFLSLRIFKDEFRASLSALIFALVPRAFSWMIMGGGLTRAPGQFFLLLALVFILQLYEEDRSRNLLLSGIFSGLAVLSHPEAAVQLVVSAGLFWLILSRRRSTFVQSILIAVVVFGVTAPWWLTVVRYHGLAPFLNAAQTGENSLAVFHLVFFTFTQEPFLTLVAVLGLTGLLERLVRREYLLPLWVIVPFFVAGRSATNLVILPLAMLAACGLADVLLPALQASGRRGAERSSQVMPVEMMVLTYLVLYMVFSAYQFGFQISAASLQKPLREAMLWIDQNTPDNSRFLVLSGSTSVACDGVSEWFPVLSGRRSLLTVQGTEWTLGADFKPFIRTAVELQRCNRSSPACVDPLIPASTYDFVFLSKQLRAENCEPLPLAQSFLFFVEEVREDRRFEVVYETDEVMVYRLR